MADNCNLTHALNSDTPSRLNKELNDNFPEHTLKEGKLEGVNEFYRIFREDPNFLNWFGDWTNEETRQELIEQAGNSAIFDENLEPRLHTKINGERYILNVKGQKWPVKAFFDTVSSEETNLMVNTLTGDYIKNPSKPLAEYINDTLDDHIENIQNRITALKEKRSKVKGRLRLSIQRTVMNLEKRIRILKSVQTNSTLLHVLEKRMKDRLEKYSFKYSEEIDDKEEADGYSDIGNFIKESNESTNRASDDPEILSFLASVPEFEQYNKDLSIQQTYMVPNKLLDSVMYVDQAAVWGMIEDLTADILPDTETVSGLKSKDVFDNFAREISQKADLYHSPELNYIADFLNNLEDNVPDPEAFKTKFVSTFYKGKQNFLITQIKKHEEGKDVNLKFSVIDPALKNDKVAKIANENIETAINSPGLNLSMNEFKALKEDLITEFEKVVKSADPIEYVVFLNEVLNNTLGLNINTNAFSYLVKSKMLEKGDVFVDVNHMIRKLLSNKVDGVYVREALTKDDLTLPEGELSLLFRLRNTTHPETKELYKTQLLSHDIHSQRGKAFMRELAEAAKIFSKDVSESSYMVGDSQRWGYSYMSGLKMEVNRWKQGDTTSLERLRFRKLSYVEKLLDDKKLDKGALEVYTNSELKTERDNSPALHKKITELDYHYDNMVKMFNSKDRFYNESIKRQTGEGSVENAELLQFRNYILYNFGAEKNSLYAIYGLPEPTEGLHKIYDPEKRLIGPHFKKILRDHVQGELLQANSASQVVAEYVNMPSETEEQRKEKQAFLMNNMIADYHYKVGSDFNIEDPDNILTAEHFKKGQYHKIGVHTPALQKYMDSTSTSKNKVITEQYGYPMVLGSFESNPVELENLMGFVYQNVNDIIKKDYDYLSNITIIRKEAPNGDLVEKKLFEVDTNIESGNPKMALYKYIISSFITNYELSNIFNGHPAFYKQKKDGDIELTDFLKRAPAVATDGKYLRKRNTGKSKTYTDFNGEKHTIAEKDDHTVVAITNNIDIDRSKHADLISNATGQDLSFDHEIADAQGYVTPQHFKDLLERTFSWTEFDQKMFDELNNPNHKVTDENIRWIKNSNKAYTPLKFVHFEVSHKRHPEQVLKENEPGVPIYLKYSLAPLFPAMTNGTEMQMVLDQMNKQRVDQIVFKSGSKASNPAPTTIHNQNEEGYQGIKSDFRLNPFIIDSGKLKMQVELPTKLDRNTRMGVQGIKNIMTNMDINDPSLQYEMDDPDNPGKKKRYTAKEMYDMVNETGVRMLQTQLNRVLRDIGYENNKLNLSTVKKLLVKQMDIETETDLIHMLDTELPMEALPNFSQRAFAVISSFITKHGGKIYTNGSSVVQVANIGYDRISQADADGVFFFDGPTKLDPPLPVTDDQGNILYFPENGKGKPSLEKKEGYHMRIKKAKILLPFTSIMAKTGLSYNEFKKMYQAEKIDKKIFQNILGYRIPNQAISSNDSFEVVGILPPIAGDQAVVYHEITAKTGSDFDIDKMYLSMPNFDVKHKLKKVPNLEKFMKYKFRSGTDILNALMLDPYMSDYLKSIAGVNTHEDGSPKDVEQPILLILNHYTNLYEIARDNEQELDFRDIKDLRVKGTMGKLAVTDLLVDLKEAYEEQRGYKSDIKSRLTEEVQSIKYTNRGYRGDQNKFIELLNAILESPASYSDLMSPLDSDLVKDTIHEIAYLKSLSREERKAHEKLTAKQQKEAVDVYTEEQKESGLEQLFPRSLIKARVDMLEAKTLISIMANNMTDLSESQKVDFKLKYPIGFVDPGGTYQEVIEEVEYEDINDQNFYEGDITPDENTIFIFGSNPVGVNGNPAKGTGGAALVAQNEFGVKQGEKMDNKLSESGQAYGLTTVTGPGKKKSKSPAEITEGIKKLYQTATQNPDKTFKVAYRHINKRSLNGYTGLEMIDMFNEAGPAPANVMFSKEWVDTGKLKSGQKTINVYWGQDESERSTKILSNLAPRKFTYQGREYGSVEHAYQSLKSGSFDENTYEKYNKIGGAGRKIRGKRVTKGFNNLQLMKNLVVESFAQNPDSEAAKKLLAYDNFTHNTNEIIDQAFLEGLKLAQQKLGKKPKTKTKTVTRKKYLEEHEATSLARIYQLGKHGDPEYKISKIVSYLMNASVDAAKDNYIISGNFNSYTANGAMLMVRLGVPLNDVFTILMNPTIMEFSRYKNYQKSKVADFSSQYTQDDLDKWSKKVIEKIKESGGNIFDVISRDDFLNDPANKKEDILGFWNLIQTMGKDFNDAVVAMKSDSKGSGKSIAEFMAMKNRITKVKLGATENSDKKWFTNGFTPENEKFNTALTPDAKILGAMANNTIYLMDEISKKLFIETTPNVQEAVNMMVSTLGSTFDSSENTFKLLYGYLYPYLLHTTGHRSTNISKKQQKYLLKTFPKKLLKYKIKKEQEKGGRKNKFLDQLYIETHKNENLIKFPNFKNFTAQDKINFKESISAMMDDPLINELENGKPGEFFGLVHDMVQYAFLTTGFKSTYYAFNDVLPAEYFLNTMHGKVIDKFIGTLNDPVKNSIDYRKALTVIAKNNPSNFKIVKKLGSKAKAKNTQGPSPIKSGEPITNDMTLERLQTKDGFFRPFFRKSKNLFMLTNINAQGHPIYKSIKEAPQRDFKVYEFHDIEEGLMINNQPYVNDVDRLYEEHEEIDTNITEPEGCS